MLWILFLNIKYCFSFWPTFRQKKSDNLNDKPQKLLLSKLSQDPLYKWTYYTNLWIVACVHIAKPFLINFRKKRKKKTNLPEKKLCWHRSKLKEINKKKIPCTRCSVLKSFVTYNGEWRRKKQLHQQWSKTNRIKNCDSRLYQWNNGYIRWLHSIAKLCSQ